LFEALNFKYVGPIQGHRVNVLLETFTNVKEMLANGEGPILVHAITAKGYGYEPAQQDPFKYHGVGAFDVASGAFRPSKPGPPKYQNVFADTLIRLAREDERIVAITAAMADGTGLDRFKEVFPERFYDVGIAEQHAVTFAAGLASEGMKPVPAIYSTFLQRAYDQIVHDVCLQNLDVTFALDRAGIVGADGATHQGRRHPPGLLRLLLLPPPAQRHHDGAQGRERAAAHAAHGGGVPGTRCSAFPARHRHRRSPGSGSQGLARRRGGAALRCPSARRSCSAMATTRPS
jgi:hypothetical protein